jgi:hypothetical protein
VERPPDIGSGYKGTRSTDSPYPEQRLAVPETETRRDWNRDSRSGVASRA